MENGTACTGRENESHKYLCWLDQVKGIGRRTSFSLLRAAAEGNLFSGDTLFYNSFGRTDLGAGDMDTIKASLERLFLLPPETAVHPGHGIRTTIGREAEDNPIRYC